MEYVSEYIFLISRKNRKKRKKNENTKKKEKETKEEKIISPENKFKKNCSCPGEDFSRHPHFRKQEFFFFGLNKERYGVSLCIQSKYGIIRTRITPNKDTFLVFVFFQ